MQLADSALEEAFELRETLVKSAPDDREYRYALAGSYNALAAAPEDPTRTGSARPSGAYMGKPSESPKGCKPIPQNPINTSISSPKFTTPGGPVPFPGGEWSRRD